MSKLSRCYNVGKVSKFLSKMSKVNRCYTSNSSEIRIR